MAIAESWHVRARGRECAATQTSFSEGETIVTALFPDPESSGYLRRDFCIQGWTDHQASGEKAFSFWKTTYSIPTGNEKPNPVEKLSAEEILRRLVDEDEDHTENTRFILAVMLERQKILRETDSQRTPNGILRVYEQRKTGEIYIVKDPDIPLSQVETVQNEVFILLENNGNSPKPVETTEAPAETDAEAPSEPTSIPVATEEVPGESSDTEDHQDPTESDSTQSAGDAFP